MPEEIQKLKEEIAALKQAVTILADVCKQTRVMGCAYIDKQIHDLVYKH